MNRTLQTVATSIKERILEHGPGWCFTSRDFQDLNSATGIRSTLSRLCRDKMIRRLTQGLYEYPRESLLLGVLPPQVDQIARAYSEKNGVRIQPSGAYAANLVGLSEQVPARIVFLTTGPCRKLVIGKLEIQFRTASDKTMFTAGTKVGLAIQAIRSLGKDHIDRKTHMRLSRFLKATSKEDLIASTKYAPQWIRMILLNLKIEKEI